MHQYNKISSIVVRCFFFRFSSFVHISASITNQTMLCFKLNGKRRSGIDVIIWVWFVQVFYANQEQLLKSRITPVIMQLLSLCSSSSRVFFCCCCSRFNLDMLHQTHNLIHTQYYLTVHDQANEWMMNEVQSYTNQIKRTLYMLTNS